MKKIEKNLYEIRVSISNKIIRSFYFHLVDNKYYIMNGFVKKTQKTPKREIDRAREIRERILEVLKDKKEE